MRIGRGGRAVATLLAALALAGCAAGGSAGSGNTTAGVQPANPFYGVPASMMRPDGTMSNGLLPINPDDQS